MNTNEEQQNLRDAVKLAAVVAMVTKLEAMLIAMNAANTAVLATLEAMTATYEQD